ncbi:DUF1987 domain-containing protein [Fulvivirga sp. M361]|uniref:DUF1987 domain-containing protein n=1 Tax=Fulvivirga sp. M361 TaxID=2594266 RepID=UPI00117BA3B9|nr:DUF1987 domain-containing protein [Fulvivirga sp. M361]TRX61274.1 DUF1987 domain-containing protein [Fulvivirga sp. M361]
MSKLFLEPTEDSPRILFNSDTGHLVIRGRSFMEDTSPFYFAIIEWLRDYFKNPKPYTLLELEFDYINSASYRMVVDVIGELNKYFVIGYIIEVRWGYYPDDECLAEMGEELKDMFDLPIQSNVIAS